MLLAAGWSYSRKCREQAARAGGNLGPVLFGPVFALARGWDQSGGPRQVGGLSDGLLRGAISVAALLLHFRHAQFR